MVQNQSIMTDAQFGFKPELGTRDAIFALLSLFRAVYKMASVDIRLLLLKYPLTQ